MKMAEVSGQIFLVALTVLACVAASPIYYVEEPLSRSEFDREIQELKQSISELTKAKDSIQSLRYEVDHPHQQLDEWEDDPQSLQIQLISSLRKVEELDDRIKRLESPDKVTARTCEEIHYFEPHKPSGDYWVDPDGHLAGDSPIKVYCNMTTGATLVYHDAEEPAELGVCLGSGCQQKPVNYKATTRQILALMRESAECHQYFQFKLECPDVFEMSESSRWIDRNGNSQYYSNCSLQEIEGEMCHWSCRLQSSTNDLPVTQLSLGRNSYATEPYDMNPGVFWLGKLECTGRYQGNAGPREAEREPAESAVPSDVTVLQDMKSEEGSKDVITHQSKTSDLKKIVNKVQSCPENIGWKTHCHQTDTGCYCLVENRLTRSEAYNFCKTQGMDLVSIESQEEQNQLNDLLSKYDGKYWWTSGSVENGQWIWASTGKPFVYNNWASKNENVASDQFFMQLEHSDTFAWNTFNGADVDYSVCEYLA